MKITELIIAEGTPKPLNKKLWSQVLAQAKSKFAMYPSAYANAWASAYYARKGGKWRMEG